MDLHEQIVAILSKARNPKCSLSKSEIPRELFLATRPDADHTEFFSGCDEAAKAIDLSAIAMPGLNISGCNVTIDYYPACNEQVIHIGFGNDGVFKTRNEPGGKH